MRATFQRTTTKTNRTDQREVGKKVAAGSIETDLPVGDGKAEVGVTRGLKTWFSTREAGMTVESTVYVQLTCGQSEAEIKAAAEEAGRIAESLALVGSEEMGLHMEPLIGGEEVKTAPPVRRSEHPKHRRYR